MNLPRVERQAARDSFSTVIHAFDRLATAAGVSVRAFRPHRL